jgi:hypothetical protein
MGSRTGQLRSRSRRLTVVGGLALVVALAGELSASAVGIPIGEVGEAFPPDALNSCIPADPLNTSLELFQTSRADGIGYVVPRDGVITSWSFHGSGLQGSQVTLRVYRPEPPDQFVPVGDGGPVQALSGDRLFVTGTRLPVEAGEIIGLRSEKVGGVSGGICASAGGNGDTYRFLAGTAPTDLGAAANYSEASGLKLDISAEVEHDVDGDGYGDESQDACPRLSSTQDACPIPNTTITSHPASRTRHRTARFRFASDVAGATFQCRLDDNLPHRCTSPVTVKVKPGRHTFRVIAHGNQASDPTPASYRWRVRR